MHLTTWLGSLSGKALEIANDALRLLSDSSKGESPTDRQPGGLNPRGPEERGPKEVITSNVLGPPPTKEQHASTVIPAFGRNVKNDARKELRYPEDDKVDDQVDDQVYPSIK